MQGDDIPPDEREVVALKNASELSLLMRRYPAITIHSTEFKSWRPTMRSTGNIPGVLSNLTVLCTDGVLCYFLTENDQIFCGHAQFFSGEVKTLFSITPPDKPKGPKKKRLTQIERALNLLLGLKPKE